MKKKSPSISLFVMIAVIGLLISFLNGDFAIAPILEDLEVNSLEVLLEYLNLGLGFLALAGIFIFWIWRATRDDKEFFWEFDKDDNQE
ncbi:MAG: hypothetical protein J7L35_10385, partial [Anaerolineales bacterium]|nr:hypothetical protein [Anaerolineales bacterium]